MEIVKVNLQKSKFKTVKAMHGKYDM